MLRHTFITAHNQRPATKDQLVNTTYENIFMGVLSKLLISSL